MSFFSRFFLKSQGQNLPSLNELLEARGIPPDLPGLHDEFLNSYGAMGASEREAVADAIASLYRQDLQLPAPWSEAQYSLMPQVAPTWQGEREPYFYRPCFDNLCVRLLSDGNLAPPEWFILWDLPEDEVISIATDRLEELTKAKPFVRLPSGIYRSDFGDGLDASRILLPDCWSQLFPGQNTFIAIPNQDTLFAAPQVLLPKLAEAIGDAIAGADKGSKGFLVATMYQWVGNKLMPASLQEPHPMIQPQREFRQMDSIAAYNAQAEDLAKMKIGTPCPLGLVKTQQGRTLTVATWVEGKPALLPDSDLIGFVSSKGRPLGMYWRQTLPRLQRIKGGDVDIWGPRRLVFSTFPTPDELEQLECFATPDIHAKVMNPQSAKQGRPAQSAPIKPKQQQPQAATASAASNSPVPAHLRGLSLGVQGGDD